jgi:hypothetical protein
MNLAVLVGKDQPEGLQDVNLQVGIRPLQGDHVGIEQLGDSDRVDKLIQEYRRLRENSDHSDKLQ